MTLPFVPDIMARPDDVEMPPIEGPDPDPDPGQDPEQESESDGRVRRSSPTVEVETELPTQAGLPIFDDETDDVSWLEKRRDPPPPPPPFEEPPERPLFAPDDTPRRPRRVLAEPTGPVGTHRGPKGDEYWPFRTSGGSSSGSGTIPAYVEADDETVPGRRCLRLAGPGRARCWSP